ncbi:islet amyloid polypeptide [Phacochoerus africanus]|uniref:islet amyloid polypeptide n=1 Tax=Phacochoerus africanus TaxID=41426 RepID=UPI001FDA0E10|nr:islet amyloid polypeptide [Phacochoerus africanus]
MSILKLPVILIVFSVTLNHLEATSIENHQMEKQKCNMATCATQHLANFLDRSRNNLGTIFSPTKVGPNAYGKRDTVEILMKEPLNYLPL